MRELTGVEERHVKSLVELRECDAIQVDFEQEGLWGTDKTGASSIFNDVPGWEGVLLDSKLERCMVGVSQLSSCWRTIGEGKRLAGEFNISDFFTCLMRRPPEMGWDGSSSEELKFFSELRVIDDTPYAANGLLAAVRIQPGVNPLEIWYYDKDLSRTPGFDTDYLRMDVDYCEYLEALLLTKGTFGWQYLFTDSSLTDERFRHVVVDLKYMLELFPRVFPNYDYAPLAERLEARL